MHRIKLFTYILLLGLVFSCIKPFTPVIEGDAANKLVVSGMISSVEGWQEVDVSYSSSVETEAYDPVSGCEVNIHDDKGNLFPLNETDAGKYRGWIAQEYLVTGNAYYVSVVTPDGERVESAYDTLVAGAALDTVYYAVEDIPTNDPGIFNTVMQFYTDLNGTQGQSRFYSWEIKETWEYHSAHPAEYFYDGKFHQLIPPDYSRSVCYANMSVKNIYTLSTKNLSQNIFDKFPLHSIDGHSPRLGVMYSILVTQQSITESTYNYLEIVRQNSAGFGGLYERQPFSIKGNIVNLSHPEKEVLGCFYAASESSKRYFYSDIAGIELDFSNGCAEYGLPMSGWQGFKEWDYPVYYYYTESEALLILTDPCIDCQLRGGTLVKPDYWPE
jgi:hypothetical protein